MSRRIVFRRHSEGARKLFESLRSTKGNGQLSPVESRFMGLLRLPIEVKENQFMIGQFVECVGESIAVVCFQKGSPR